MALVWLLIIANTVIAEEFSCGLVEPKAKKDALGGDQIMEAQ